MLGPPSADVLTSRTVLDPLLSRVVTVALAQVSQLPVLAKERAGCTTLPLTMMSIGRAVAVPLAYRMVRLASLVDGAFTVICAAEPAALVRLQKPAPEKLRWLLSMVPSQVPLSASNRLPGPWVGE